MEPLVRCPHCGQYHKSSLTHCPRTGLPIYVQDPESPRRISKRMLWIGIATAVLLTLACIFISLWLIPGLIDQGSDLDQQIPPISVATITLPPFTTRVAASPSQAPQPTETIQPTASPTAEAWQACETASYLSQLRVGDQAEVSNDPPLANRVRENAGTEYTVLGYIDPGEKVEVLEGPACSEGWVWWRVRSLESGLTGWTAEGDVNSYWLIPSTE